MNFIYGDEAVEYLRSRDRKLAACIDQIGHIDRHVDDDVFSSVVHQIIGQQISTKALETIWSRMRDDLGYITAQAILDAGADKIQSFGMTFRKASYIRDFAEKIVDGSFDQNRIMQLPDDEAVAGGRSLGSQIRQTGKGGRTDAVFFRISITSGNDHTCRR